jgi:TonB family protein
MSRRFAGAILVSFGAVHADAWKDAMAAWSAVRLLPVAVATVALFAGGAVAIADDAASSPTLNSHKRGNMRGALPYDRSYAQLSPEQKAVLRAEYDSVGPNDEPPYPKYGLSEVADAVARMPVRAPIDGEVVLTVRVDERGDAKSVSIYKSPDGRLSNVIAATLTRTKFKPGLCEGRPCAMDYVFRFHFKFSG